MKNKLIGTKLVHCGRDRELSSDFINIPPYRGSTVLFDSVEDMFYRENRKAQGEYETTYGTDGGPTHQALFKAFCELEGGYRAWAYSTGLAGCVMPILALTACGDHILVTDSVYGPVRSFCEKTLTRFGVEVEFYDPLIAGGIESLFRSNTKLVYMESPGTHSFEVQDVPAIAAAARRHGIRTMIDNTWATPLYFRPMEHGVDIVVHALTKYIGGHSDILMAIATCNEETWPAVRDTSNQLGQLVGADDAYLALRGLHTLKPRLEYQSRSAREIIAWLKEQPLVERIHWPADEDDPGYSIWKRDFSGASSLFAITFKDEVSDEQIRDFASSLKVFGRGYSWGGFESLVCLSYGKRECSSNFKMNKSVRIAIGLEDTEDLIEDLKTGFETMLRTPL